MEYPYPICGDVRPFGVNEIICDRPKNHSGWHSGEISTTVYRWE